MRALVEEKPLLVPKRSGVSAEVGVLVVDDRTDALCLKVAGGAEARHAATEYSDIFHLARLSSLMNGSLRRETDAAGAGLEPRLTLRLRPAATDARPRPACARGSASAPAALPRACP